MQHIYSYGPEHISRCTPYRGRSSAVGRTLISCGEGPEFKSICPRRPGTNIRQSYISEAGIVGCYNHLLMRYSSLVVGASRCSQVYCNTQCYGCCRFPPSLN